MVINYIGSGNYCYANSAAMVLQGFGFSYDPAYLECLTAVANSAFWTDNSKNPFIFFSAKYNSPDAGISLALKSLGFQFDEFYLRECGTANEEFLLSKLKDFLEYGPVIVGPLDMGKLTYIPYSKDLKGVDHYAVVYGVGDNIHMHDPAGYPHIQIEICDFMESWKAASIKYRRGSYSMWGNIKRAYEPSELEVYTSTHEAIKRYVMLEKESNDDLVGSKAILKLASLVLEEKLSPTQRGNLAYFSFCLASRRCADYANFFKPYDPIRSDIKIEMAKCFGISQMYFMKKNYKPLYETLCHLADLEEEFQLRTLEL